MGLLEADPDLAQGLPAESRLRAQRALRVPVITLERGAWNPPQLSGAAIGVMVLDGLLLRTLHLPRATSAELVGPGDMLRPWEESELPGMEPHPSAWRALDRAAIALLDERATAGLAIWPSVITILAARFLRRSRCLTYLMAAQHLRRVEDRLLLTLWHIGSKWGHVTTQGVRLPVRLTHEMLAQVVGVRRPTISTALSALSKEGRVIPDDRGQLVLLGQPPDWPHSVALTPRDVAVR